MLWFLLITVSLDMSLASLLCWLSVFILGFRLLKEEDFIALASHDPVWEAFVQEYTAISDKRGSSLILLAEAQGVVSYSIQFASLCIWNLSWILNYSQSADYKLKS